MLRTTLTTLALASLLAPTSQAQAELEWSGGVLGGAVSYEMTGPAGQLYYLLPSLTPGPTPLAWFDPADPRLLNVGLDLMSFASLGFLTPTASKTLPIPAIPTLAGFELRAQFVSIDPTFSSPTLVGEVSNLAAFILGGSGDVVGTRGNVLDSRQGHSATLLQDGRVLVIGGDERDALGNLQSLDSTEFYDPQTQTFTPGPTLTQKRSTHTATLLQDGRVLVTGGYPVYGPGVASATAEVWDPTTNAFTAVSAPGMGRTLHTATLLNNGKVMVVGGGAKFDLGDVFGSLAAAVPTTEIYDPVTDTWTSGPSLPKPLFAHQTSLLGDGKLLISSGVEVASLFGAPIPGITTACHRFDPSSPGTFLPTASVPAGRAYHGQLTLPTGGAMMIGGATGDFIALSFTTHTDVFTYNHTTNAWTSAGNLAVGRAYPNLVDTGSGIAVLSGLKSVDITTGSGTPATEIETTDYSGISWTTAANQTLARETARAVPVDGGQRILIVGVGDNGLPANDLTAEVFIP